MRAGRLRFRRPGRRGMPPRCCAAESVIKEGRAVSAYWMLQPTFFAKNNGIGEKFEFFTNLIDDETLFGEMKFMPFFNE